MAHESLVDLSPLNCRGARINREGTLMLVVDLYSLLFYDTTHWFQSPTNAAYNLTLLFNYTDVGLSHFEASLDLSVVYTYSRLANTTYRLVRTGNAWVVSHALHTDMSYLSGSWCAAPEAERVVWRVPGSDVVETHTYQNGTWLNTSFSLGASSYSVMELSGNGEVLVNGDKSRRRITVHRWMSAEGTWVNRTALQRSDSLSWPSTVIVSHDGSRVSASALDTDDLMIWRSST
jgi:hypothetical protein